MSDSPGALADADSTGERRRAGLGRGVLDDARYRAPAKHTIFSALAGYGPGDRMQRRTGPVAPVEFVEPPAVEVEDVPLATAAVVLENPQPEDEIAAVVTISGIVDREQDAPQRLSEHAALLGYPAPTPAPAPVVEKPVEVGRSRSLSDALARLKAGT